MIRFLRGLTNKGAIKNLQQDVTKGLNDGLRDAMKDPKTKKVVERSVKKAVKEQSQGMINGAIKDAMNPKMSLTKKIVYGGGAAAAGVAGYSALRGVNADALPIMDQAKNAGAEAAYRDAMTEGYGPVLMGAPMPQVQAANLNYAGTLGPQMAMARG